MRYGDEQLRVAANLRQYYNAWLESTRALDRLNSQECAAGSSLEAHQEKKNEIISTLASRKAKLGETGNIYGVLQMGRISSSAAAILRKADTLGYLGSMLMVVGTNALLAYEMEAASPFATGMSATEDFDMAWCVNNDKVDLSLLDSSSVNLLDMLKSIDSTYTVNTERTFQARNKDAYEVELLVSPSRAGTMPKTLGLSPIALPEQEWLLQGRLVDQVVCGFDNSPAHIIAPDPRWFALQKLWMADKPERNPLKKPKDRRQGVALLNAVAEYMPHYPLDETFQLSLPPELAMYFERWQEENVIKPTPFNW